MDKNKIKKYLTTKFISEETTPGISVTASARKKSGESNKKGVKDIDKNLSDYEKSLEKGMETTKTPNKFNYEDKFEETYHNEMEIMNGQEMVQYDSKPSALFSERAEEAIVGSSRMGNNPEWANVMPEQQGFVGPDFGKNLVKNIKASVEKRNDQTPTLNLRGRDIQADIKDSGNRPYALQENNNNNKNNNNMEKNKVNELTKGFVNKVRDAAVDKRDNTPSEDPFTKNRLSLGIRNLGGYMNPEIKAYVEKLGGEISEDSKSGQIVIKFHSEGGNANYIFILITADRAEFKNGALTDLNQNVQRLLPKLIKKIQDDFNSQNDNQSEIKESMKRLKFKNPFNGVGNALKMIPESYRVDNKQFEMTDGNESYKIRWEGNLTEGRAVVLMASDKNLVNEDMAHMKHLMGYKSNETLGLVKGKSRIDENAVFGDIYNKTKALLEGEDIESVKVKTGNFADVKKKAPEATKHVQGKVSKDKMEASAKEGDLDDAVSHAPEAKKHVAGSVSKDKGTKAPAAKTGNWSDVKKKAAEATKHVTMKESFNAEEENEEEVTTENVEASESSAKGVKKGEWDKIKVPHAAEAKKHIHMGKESKAKVETEAKEEMNEGITINGIRFEPINEGMYEEGMYEEGIGEQYYVAIEDMDEPGEANAHIVSSNDVHEYEQNGWDLRGPFSEEEANKYLDKIHQSNRDFRYYDSMDDREGKSNLYIDPLDKFEKGGLDTNW